MRIGRVVVINLKSISHAITSDVVHRFVGKRIAGRKYRQLLPYLPLYISLLYGSPSRDCRTSISGNGPHHIIVIIIVIAIVIVIGIISKIVADIVFNPVLYATNQIYITRGARRVGSIINIIIGILIARIHHHHRRHFISIITVIFNAYTIIIMTYIFFPPSSVFIIAFVTAAFCILIFFFLHLSLPFLRCYLVIRYTFPIPFQPHYPSASSTAQSPKRLHMARYDNSLYDKHRYEYGTHNYRRYDYHYIGP
mmetsp:Transcript_21318/g.38088  ORF Transcript_21318/g.38088 Transcript_21318/m.38088 type:complete len:252 (-) Transcript_21318:99-854(-)